MLAFNWILRVGRIYRIFFVLRRDPNDVGGVAWCQESEKKQCEQNSKGRFHTLKESNAGSQLAVPPESKSDFWIFYFGLSTFSFV
jgi:hypothetical protein